MAGRTNWLPGAAGAGLTSMMQVGPSEAKGNFCKWVSSFADTCLSIPELDKVLWVVVSLLVLWTVGSAIRNSERFKPMLWPVAIITLSVVGFIVGVMLAVERWPASTNQRTPDGDSKLDKASSSNVGIDTLPISIKRAPRSPPYAWEAKPFGDVHDDELFTVGPVYITNNSASRPLTLDISLALHHVPGNPIEMIHPGTGVDWVGRKIGQDEPSRKYIKNSTPYLYSPLKLWPQETAFGVLPFFAKGDGNHNVYWKPELQIIDAATGEKIRIPVGSEYPPRSET